MPGPLPYGKWVLLGRLRGGCRFLQGSMLASTRGRMQASSGTAPRHIVASSASISAFVARPRLNAVALPQAVPRRRAAS